MFDDFVAYYHENAIAAFIEYREWSGNGVAGRSRDLRSALEAATALFHLREHLPAHAAISRAAAEKACADYALLGDIVNAAKHRSVSRATPHGAPLVSDAKQILEQLYFIEYEDSAGTYRFVQKNVLVTLPDGTERNLLEITTNVVNFWERHLSDHGVLASARQFKDDSAVRFRSRAECEENRLNFEIVQGQRFQQKIRLLRFDNDTQSLQPIDLTGAKLEFRIYRPTFDVDLTLTHEASGRTLNTTVTLSEAESDELALIDDPAQRQAYINALPSVQSGLRDLAMQAGLMAPPAGSEPSQG